MSGARTTYAVMVVPVDAEALVMETSGCYFPRSDYQPISFHNTTEERWTSSESRRCNDHKAFVVPIPGGGARENYDFWVSGLEYVPAEKGDRVVLSIYGRNFPAQIGMMVDGVPLTQSIGVAQPLIRDDSAAFREASAELKEAKVIGRIERIDSQQLVAVFEKPNGKDGTQPIITLTAPGKAKILNTMNLYINNTRNTTLAQSALMFGKRPADKDRFRIDKVEIFRSRVPHFLTATLRGDGFQDAAGNSALGRVLVNGTSAVSYTVDSQSHMRIDFRIPADENIRVTLVTQNANPAQVETAISDPVPNPARLRVNNVSVVSYEPGGEDEPGTLVVKIEGSGFSDELRSSLGELAVKSAGEAILKITQPEAAAVVILTDRATGQQVRTVITRTNGQK